MKDEKGRRKLESVRRGFSGLIKHLLAGKLRIADDGLETMARPEINRAAKQGRDLTLDVGEHEQAHLCSRFELNQHVNVAVRAEIVAQRGAEEPEVGDAVSAAELGQGRARDGTVG